MYVTLLRETKKQYNFHLHSYCLMTNHVHLQIETVDINISIIMKRINLLYAQFFNNKYNFVGHLFQDRFKSELIETDQCSGRKRPPKIIFGGHLFRPRGLVLPAICRIVDTPGQNEPVFRCEPRLSSKRHGGSATPKYAAGTSVPDSADVQGRKI